MNTISKDLLKDSVRMTVAAFEELKDEGIKLNIGGEDLIKCALSLYIQESRNGNGYASPQAKPKTGESNGNGNMPASPGQLNFLRKHGPKTLILTNLNRGKASELIEKITSGWNKK